MTTLSRRIGTILECVNFPTLRHAATPYNATVTEAKGLSVGRKASVKVLLDPNQSQFSLAGTKPKKVSTRQVTVARSTLTDFVNGDFSMLLDDDGLIEVGGDVETSLPLRLAQLGYEDDKLVVEDLGNGQLRLSVLDGSPNFYGAPVTIDYILDYPSAINGTTLNGQYNRSSLVVSPVPKTVRDDVLLIARTDYPFALETAGMAGAYAEEFLLTLPPITDLRDLNVAIVNETTGKSVTFEFRNNFGSDLWSVTCTEDMSDGTVTTNSVQVNDGAALRFFALGDEYGMSVVGAANAFNDFVSTSANRGALPSIFIGANRSFRFDGNLTQATTQAIGLVANGLPQA